MPLAVPSPASRLMRDGQRAGRKWKALPETLADRPYRPALIGTVSDGFTPRALRSLPSAEDSDRRQHGR